MKKSDMDQPITLKLFQEGIDAVISAMDDMFGKLNTKLDYVNKNLSREIRGLKTDTPTMKEFTALKAKVDRFTSP